MRTHHYTRRLVGLAASAALVMGVAACGGDDDDDSSAADTPDTTDAPATTDAPETTDAPATTDAPDTTDAPADLIDVPFGNFGVVASAPGYAISLNEDAFVDNGVNLIQNPPVYNAADIITTLLTGDADIIYTGITAPVAAVAAGQEVRIVAIVNSGFALEVALNEDVITDLAAEGVTVDSPIEEKVAALAGLTLASSAAGSSGDLVLRFALAKYGVNPDSDVTIQPAPDVPSIVAAARDGAADGATGIAGGPATILASEGGAEVFINFADEDPEIGELPLQVLVSTPDYIADNPDAVAGVVNGFAVGRDALAAGLTAEQYDELKQATAPDMDPTLFDAALADGAIRGSRPFTMTQEQLDVAAAVFNLTAIAPFEGTLDDIADNTFAAAADASSGL